MIKLDSVSIAIQLVPWRELAVLVSPNVEQLT